MFITDKNRKSYEGINLGGGFVINIENPRQVSEKIWLNYFNSVLFEKGVITESERNKMVMKIAARK